jgi:Fic family protein
MRIPEKPKEFAKLLADTSDRFGELLNPDVLSSLPESKYLHWDSLRHRPPPEGLTREEWWLAIKFSRVGNRNALPFKDKHEARFTYNLPPFIQRMLHLVDRDASGRIELPEVVTNPHTRDRFLVRSLIEEAITSSQLEGAATTRSEAKSMLKQGRRPRNRSEQMILNNYHAMEFIRDLSSTPITKEIILELHTILMVDTLDDPAAAGRWRNSSENIRVVDQRDEKVLHIPPAAQEIEDRVECLCQFANAGDKEAFIHPVLRSILIHFMIGYDHPFVDGNGRMARALFYWSMAKHGYWMMEFISISTILRNAPSAYALSYLFTETDECDTTYFIDYQLRIIIRAIKSLHDYLTRKTTEIQQADGWLKGSLRSLLNHRQVALVQHSLKHNYEDYTVRSHMRSHGVTYETSRSDLLGLTRIGLLEKTMRGRAFVFRAPEDLRDRLRELRAAV